MFVLGTVLLPEPAMAFIVAGALSGQRKSGLATVAGVMAGSVCDVALGATAIALLLKFSSLAFWVSARRHRLPGSQQP